MAYKTIVAALGLGLLASCGPGPSGQTQSTAEGQNSNAAIQSARTLVTVAAPNLPQQMSANLTWSQAHSVGTRFVMSYVVHHNLADLSPIINEMKSSGIRESTSRLCSQADSKKALDFGVIYVYVFVSQDNQALYDYEITRYNCT